jgi:hypothetical protein
MVGTIDADKSMAMSSAIASFWVGQMVGHRPIIF